MAEAHLNDKAKYWLCDLLVRKGTKALRKLFDTFYSSTLANFLEKVKGLLFKLKLKVINKKQWDLLFPIYGNPDSKKFDISLLSILLRNICGLTPPPTGWSTTPSNADRSQVANIVRLRLYRDEIYTYAAIKEVTEDKFEDLWSKISQTLIELGITWSEIGQLRKRPALSSEGKDTYLVELEEWKSQEEEMNKMLHDDRKQLRKMQKTTEIVEHIEQIKESINEMEIASASQRQLDENLLLKLCKFNFNGDIQKLVHLFHPGAKERLLLLEIESWFRKSSQKVLMLTGGPGVGKSVLSAKIIQKYQVKKELAACHFCELKNSNYSNPLKMIQSLASQICDSVEGFEKKLLKQLIKPNEVENLQKAVQVYLKKPLQDLPTMKLMLVVIDGLDECEEDGKTDLLDVLAEEFPKLPAWVKVLVTSRPEISVKKTLSLLECIKIQSIESNEEDIKEHHASQLSERVDKKLVSNLRKECKSSLSYNLRKRENNKTTEAKAGTPLPEGLKAVYSRYFDRLEPKLEAKSREFTIRNFLKILAVAYQPIPLSLFAEGLELKLNLRKMKQIIENTNETIASLLLVSDESVTVSHKSTVEWLLQKNHKYTITVEEGDILLWKMMEKRLNETKENMTKKNVSSIRSLMGNTTMQYVLEHGFQHLFRASDYIDISFEWLVDVFILHLMMSESYGSCIEAWQHFLRADDDNESNSTMREIRPKVRWNYEHFSDYEVRPVYVQDIFNEGPKELFSLEEKRNAQHILDTFLHFWCEKQGYLQVMQPNRVSACSFSPDGSHLVGCIEDGRICIWKVNSLKLSKVVSFKCYHAIRCFWSEDEAILIYHHVEDHLMLSRYPVNQNSSIQDENVQTHRITASNDTPLAFSTQAFICKCSNDSSIKVHRFTKMNETMICVPEFGLMHKFAITRDGSSILAADEEYFQIWKISETNSTEYNLHKKKEIELDKHEHDDCDCIEKILSCVISNNQKWGIISYYCSKNEEPFFLVIDIDVENPRKEDNINLLYPTDEKLHCDLIDDNDVIVDDVAAAKDNDDDHYNDYDDGNDDDDDDDDNNYHGDIFYFVQSYKRITVYSNKCMGPLTHFNHNGDPEYYKKSSVCRSGNIIALPQKSGNICIVKLHLPKTNWKNFGSRIAEFQWEI